MLACSPKLPHAPSKKEKKVRDKVVVSRDKVVVSRINCFLIRQRKLVREKY